jgi:hypothetical protein
MAAHLNPFDSASQCLRMLARLMLWDSIGASSPSGRFFLYWTSPGTPRAFFYWSSSHRPNVELAVIEQREFELPADSADIGLRKE